MLNLLNRYRKNYYVCSCCKFWSSRAHLTSIHFLIWTDFEQIRLTGSEEEWICGYWAWTHGFLNLGNSWTLTFVLLDERLRLHPGGSPPGHDVVLQLPHLQRALLRVLELRPEHIEQVSKRRNSWAMYRQQKWKEMSQRQIFSCETASYSPTTQIDNVILILTVLWLSHSHTIGVHKDFNHQTILSWGTVYGTE